LLLFLFSGGIFIRNIPAHAPLIPKNDYPLVTTFIQYYSIIVAKQRSKEKNRDKTNTSILFPEFLRNKKVRNLKKKSKYSQDSKDYIKSLQEFIDDEDLEKFIKAINIFGTAIFGLEEEYECYCWKLNKNKLRRDLILHVLYFNFVELLKKKKYLPHYFVIWSTIDHLLIHLNPMNSKINNELKAFNKEIEKYLSRISPLLTKDYKKIFRSNPGCYKVINKSGVKEHNPTEDGLIHRKYYSNYSVGGKSGIILEYQNNPPHKFLNYFHKIKNIIKDDFYESPDWGKRKKSIICALF